MAVLRVCDFCKADLSTEDSVNPIPFHTVKIDNKDPLDVCEDCYTGCVILNEQRKVKAYRRRRPGRPKGSKTVKQPDNLPLPLGAVSEGE